MKLKNPIASLSKDELTIKGKRFIKRQQPQKRKQKSQTYKMALNK